jgi:asparagine synthase (glutamine-hydrolysing)
MCGIAGWVGTSSDRAADSVSAMNRAQARRGPNAEGLEARGRTVLGHRRLSIFDLSDAGRQPMLSPDGKIAVVFNGAIYNFLDLRAELERSGYRFSSNTDTEVLIHGYRAWGIERLVQRLHGMFAIGLWDEGKNKFYLIRDRLGVKPLFYSLRPDGSLAFASTARAFRAAGLADELDPIAVAEFFEFGYVTDARSIYRGIKKVHAGHLLEWSDGILSDTCYWTPPTVYQKKSISFEEAVEQTEHLFLEAVKMRLFADVPVAALLSGGVDSSLVCWAVARLGANLKAYTISTPDDTADESREAIQTALALGIPHEVLPINSDGDDGIGELVAAYGEPFACSSAIGMLQLSRAIKPEATVLLTGDGGDDVFLGYPEHRHLWMAQRLAGWIPNPLARSWYTLRKPLLGFAQARRPMHFVDYATGGLGAFVAAHDGWPRYLDEGLLGERLLDVRLDQRGIPWSHESARRVLSDMLPYDRQGRFVGEYLTKVDGATMYYGLEARSPFLDQSLWEFASSLPFSVRMHAGGLKSVLRELARRRVGDRVAAGKKRGFTIPATRWLAGKWLPQAREVFRNSTLQREGWIRSERALAQLDAASVGGRAPLQLWYLYVLENWLRYEESDQDLLKPAQITASLV